MAPDSKLLELVKDQDVQAVAFLACVLLLVIGYLGLLPAAFLPWLWVGLVVSGCFVGITILGAYFRAKAR
jgi:hypothetical protein